MININDGTKIRITEDEEFSADFPESVDMKITDHCDIGCAMCHERSGKNGKHADLNAEFLDTLRPFTEIAIGGGSVP
jgi:molybdenum cofactor biosynthesis enzyme MoaA